MLNGRKDAALHAVEPLLLEKREQAGHEVQLQMGSVAFPRRD